MSGVPLGSLRVVAARLDPLGVPYCFAGGAIATLLVDRPELSPVRETDDVDVIIEVVTEHAIAPLEQRLRDAGIVDEVNHAAEPLRGAVVSTVQEWWGRADFLESLSGLLPFDAASQARLPGLRG